MPWCPPLEGHGRLAQAGGPWSGDGGGSGMLAVIFLSVCVRGMGSVSRAREM